MGVVNYLICHKVDYSCSICVSSLPDFILKVTEAIIFYKDYSGSPRHSAGDH